MKFDFHQHRIKFISDHKSMWTQKKFFWSAFLGLLLLLFSFVVNYYANIFASSHASNAVADLILDNLPVFNVNFIFLDGQIFFIAFTFFLVFKEPSRIPFAFKSAALLILVRSAFIILTHLAIPPQHSYLEPGKVTKYITLGDDLFFSFHTALPFLMALIFWESRWLRYIFLSFSALFGTVVLLGHLHYSIDVFAAFFITYGVFHGAQFLFKNDLTLFRKIKIFP